MFRPVHIGLCLIALLLMPALAQAESVPWLVDTNTGAVIFDDNFEPPLGVPGSSPVAAAGSWSFPGVTANVTNATNAGFDANEGSQFLQVNRNGSQEMFGTGVAGNSGDGHLIRLELAFRSPASGDGGNIGVLSGSNTTANVLFNGNGTMRYLVPGVAWYDLTQTYSTTEWNTLIITHTNGATGLSAYQLSINGQAPESIGFANASGNLNGVYVASPGGGGPIYFDSITAVPEPSAIALALTGLVGLLAYAWRKRK